MRTFSIPKNLVRASVLSLFTVFAACKQAPNKEAEKGETVTIDHKLGTTEVPLSPERIVVLDFSTLENLDTLGLEPVGITKQGVPHYLKSYESDESIENVGSIAEVSLEKIYGLEPQLIFSATRLEEQYDELSRIAPTIQIYSDGTEPFKNLKADLDNIGKIFDKQEEVDKLYQDLHSKALALQEKAAETDLTALIIMHNKGKFSAYGKGSRFGIIHDFIGIKEAEEGLGTHRHGKAISSEFILEANPDILFVIDRNLAISSGQPLDKSFVENVLVQQTEAYKKNRIIYLDSQAWYLSGGGVKSITIMLDEISQAFEEK